MLKNSKVVGFVATSNAKNSKHFYRECLGLTLVEETPFAIVFESNNAVIRVQKTDKVCPPPYTSLGWEVDNIDESVRTLSVSGVRFEHFDGLDQDELGVWGTPDGSRIAWFKDPDGNLLSLTQGN